jgi:hypothetical protein
MYEFFFSSCMLYVLPISFSLIWHPNNISWGEKFMNLPTTQISPVSCHFLLLRPKYIHQLHVVGHPHPIFYH